jgi:hypothetical protein
MSSYWLIYVGSLHNACTHEHKKGQFLSYDSDR